MEGMFGEEKLELFPARVTTCTLSCTKDHSPWHHCVALSRGHSRAVSSRGRCRGYLCKHSFPSLSRFLPFPGTERSCEVPRLRGQRDFCCSWLAGPVILKRQLILLGPEFTLLMTALWMCKQQTGVVSARADVEQLLEHCWGCPLRPPHSAPSLSPAPSLPPAPLVRALG